MRAAIIFVACGNRRCALAAGAQAAEFPAKPITMVVPFTAGGPTDTVGSPDRGADVQSFETTGIDRQCRGCGRDHGAGKVAKASCRRPYDSALAYRHGDEPGALSHS